MMPCICFQLEMIMMHRDSGIMENVKSLQLCYNEVIIQRSPLAGRMCLSNQREVISAVYVGLYFL